MRELTLQFKKIEEQIPDFDEEVIVFYYDTEQDKRFPKMSIGCLSSINKEGYNFHLSEGVRTTKVLSWSEKPDYNG